MPGRKDSDSDSYRYGFQGQEQDDEIKGKGNSNTTFFRRYDPRIGRWLSRDPLEAKHQAMSPYNFVGNMPISAIDPDGRDVYLVIWYTIDGEIGHDGIAVDNYKEVTKKNYNSKGDVIGQTKVWEPDGTVTYFDHWPGDTNGNGTLDDNDGVDKSNASDNVGAFMYYKPSITLNDLENKGILVGKTVPLKA